MTSLHVHTDILCELWIWPLLLKIKLLNWLQGLTQNNTITVEREKTYTHIYMSD